MAARVGTLNRHLHQKCHTECRRFLCRHHVLNTDMLLSVCCYSFYIADGISHGRARVILHHCDEIEWVVVFSNFSSLSHGIESLHFVKAQGYKLVQ